MFVVSTIRRQLGEIIDRRRGPVTKARGSASAQGIDTNVEIRARYSAQGLYQILESYKQLSNEFT